MRKKFDKRNLSFTVIDGEFLNLPLGRWDGCVDSLFIMSWSDNSNPYEVDKLDKRSIIGYLGIDYVNNEKTPAVSYAYIKSNYRNRGIGMYMYEKCIEKYGKLSTSYNGRNGAISPDAMRIWDKLVDSHYTRKLKKGFVVYPRKKIKK